jgi:hypothetical protein
LLGYQKFVKINLDILIHKESTTKRVTRKNLFDDVRRNTKSHTVDNIDEIKDWYMSKFGAEERGSQQQSGETPMSSKTPEANDNDSSETSDDDDVKGIFTQPATNLHPANRIKFAFINYRVNSCSRAIKSVMRRLVTVSIN